MPARGGILPTAEWQDMAFEGSCGSAVESGAPKSEGLPLRRNDMRHPVTPAEAGACYTARAESGRPER